jgi:hypothetical protein
MTLTLLDRPTDAELEERVGDAALTALLRGKPRGEQVPAAVWWLIAESLRTSVTIRRAMTVGPVAEPDELQSLVTEARLLAEVALAELGEATGVRPALVVVGGADPTARRPAFGLSVSTLVLARMLVSHRATSPLRLANSLAAHMRALDLLVARGGDDGSGQPADVSGTSTIAASMSSAARR